MKTFQRATLFATALVCGAVACKSDTVIRHVPGPDDGLANSDDVGLRLRDFSNTKVSVVRARRPEAPTAPSSVSKHAPYVTDASSAWVYDVSAPAFDDLNSLLCVFGQLRYLEMLSRGVSSYRAFVNLDMCDTTRCADDDAVHDGAHPTQDGWLVDVSGDIDDIVAKPVQVHAWGQKWVTNSMGMQTLADVYAEITVNMLGEELNPFGLGTVKAVYHYEDDATPAVGTTTFSVTPSANKGEIKLIYVLDSNAHHHTQAVMYQNGAPEENTGYGKVSFITPFMDGHEDEEIQYAYDDMYFKRLSNRPEHNCAGGTEACYYDHRTFYETGLKYGLYDFMGGRVTRVSGMDVVVNYQEGQDLVLAWANMKGVWYPDGSAVAVNSNTTFHAYLYQNTVGEALEGALVSDAGVFYKTVQTEHTLDTYASYDIEYRRYNNRYWLRWNTETSAFQTLGVWNEGLNLWEATSEEVFFTGLSSDAGDYVGHFYLMGTSDEIHPAMDCESKAGSFICTPSASDAISLTQVVLPADPDLGDCDPYLDGPECMVDANTERVSFHVDVNPDARGQRVFFPYPNGSLRMWENPLPVYTLLSSGVTDVPAFLVYQSFGDLKGIPQGCVNGLTHAGVLCGAFMSRTLPLYTVADGTEWSIGGSTYFVRVMEREQRMAFLTEAPATSLEFDEDIVLPEAGEALVVGDKPAVSEERSVAAGIITGVNCLGETCVGEAVDICRASGNACAWHATCDENTVTCSCDEGYTGDGEDDCSPVETAVSSATATP